MKKTKELLAAIMTAAMVVTSFSNTGLTVWASQAEEATKEVVEEVINTTEYDYLTLNEMMEEEAENHSKEIIDLEEIFEEIPTVEAQPEEVGDSFPTSLDWSESKYFPAIGNQESTGSCGYFSIFYTNFTFAHNRTRGVETTESNTVNPVFGYNFYGIMSKNSYYLTREIGFATLGVLPLDLYSRKTLSPTKEVWESALNHRAVDIETVSNYGDGDAIITGPTDPTLNQIKQTLNDGYLIGIGTLSSSWNFSVVASGKHKGEVAIDRCDAGTIKANKVKNSSRKSYFMYNDFNRPKIREKDNSGCICYMTVNTGSRKEMTMTVTATSKADGTKESYQFIKMDLEKENLSWDGTTNATDGTMVFDLENAVSDISGSTMEDYEWEVIFEDDTADAYALTVKDLYFTVDGTKTYTTNISKIPLNGTEKVYKMVPISEGGIAAEKENTVTVYYNNSKFDSAYIHYRAGDGTWTTAPGVQR